MIQRISTIYLYWTSVASSYRGVSGHTLGESLVPLLTGRAKDMRMNVDSISETWEVRNMTRGSSYKVERVGGGGVSGNILFFLISNEPEKMSSSAKSRHSSLLTIWLLRRTQFSLTRQTENHAEVQRYSLAGSGA